MATDEKLDPGILEAMTDERHELAQLMEVRETAREAFIRREDLSRRVARAMLRKSAPITREYGVGDLVCFKTEQSGWSTASRIIGFEGPIFCWIHQRTLICAALDRLRPVNAAEALAYQHLKDEKGLGAIQGRKIGFVDITRPLDGQNEDENDSGYEAESPIETHMGDDDGVIEVDEDMRERRQRVQSTATLEEPDTEMMPASRRRSGEQENLLDDVPISIRRRICSPSRDELSNYRITGKPSC